MHGRQRQGGLKSGPCKRRHRRDRSEGSRESSGAEEDGFALEHLDGEEQGYGGIHAGGNKDDGDEIPVVSAGDKFFAEEAHVKNGDERELGSKLDAGEHGGDRRDNDDESQRRQIALRFLVGFGEQSNGHQGGGKEYGERQSHDKDR